MAGERPIPTEITRIKEAASIVRKRPKGDRSRLLRRANRKDAGIFLVHISILEDSHSLNGIISGLAEERINAETAVIRELDKYSALFSRIEDHYLKERIVDIRDLGHRLLEVLIKPKDSDWPFDEPMVIATEELTPYDTIPFTRERVLAFVTEQGEAISCADSGPVHGDSGSRR